MSNYFKYFDDVDYKFGDETDATIFQDISLMSTVIDQVADGTSLYSKYYVLPDERPDQVSQKLYGRPDYHWTFYILNPELREKRWPMSPGRIFTVATEKYPGKVITTRTKLTDKFKVGQTITGQVSEATATIKERNLDLGLLLLENIDATFVADENVNSTNSDGAIEVIVVNSFVEQYNAPHHYINADGDYVDIDPEVGPGGLLTEKTNLDHLRDLNEANSQIKVFRKDFVTEIVNAFRESLN